MLSAARRTFTHWETVAGLRVPTAWSLTWEGVAENPVDWLTEGCAVEVLDAAPEGAFVCWGERRRQVALSVGQGRCWTDLRMEVSSWTPGLGKRAEATLIPQELPVGSATLTGLTCGSRATQVRRIGVGRTKPSPSEVIE